MGALCDGDLRFMVQAVNGAGLVTIATNNGEYFTLDVDPGAPPALPDQQPSTLVLLAPPTVGAYATTITVSAELSTSTGLPIPNAVVEFSQNTQNLKATTDGDGRAAVSLLLLGKPGPDTLNATFVGAALNAPAKASSPFTLTKQPTCWPWTRSTPSCRRATR